MSGKNRGISIVRMPFFMHKKSNPHEKNLIFTCRWSKMVLNVEESGRQWYKVVDKLITLWITCQR